MVKKHGGVIKKGAGGSLIKSKIKKLQKQKAEEIRYGDEDVARKIQIEINTLKKDVGRKVDTTPKHGWWKDKRTGQLTENARKKLIKKLQKEGKPVPSTKRVFKVKKAGGGRITYKMTGGQVVDAGYD